MRRALAVTLAAGLLFGAIAAPATAAKKKKKKAKPVETTLYLHGYSQFGEVDGIDWLTNSAPPMSMDTTEPEGSQPKSMNYGSGPWNDQCSGLPLIPTWVGDLSGTIVGDATLTVHLLSQPATSVTARLWTDTPIFSCNDGYIPPAAEVEVDVPPGQAEVEIVFEDLKLPAQLNAMVEVLIPEFPVQRANLSRVFYDAVDYASALTFDCIPKKGKTCA